MKRDLEGIILSNKSHVDEIFLVSDHNTDSTNSREITRKKLSLKGQY